MLTVVCKKSHFLLHVITWNTSFKMKNSSDIILSFNLLYTLTGKCMVMTVKYFHKKQQKKKIIPAWGNTCNSKKTKIPH